MHKEVLSVAQDLIQLETYAGNKPAIDKCVQYVEQYFASTPALTLKKFTFNETPSLIISNQRNTKHFKFLLNGHLDVVTGTPANFQPKVGNGRLYGRGAADMKTMVAAMMVAMKYAAYEKTDTAIGFMMVFDEEVGGFNGTAKLIDAGYSAELVLIPDDMGEFELTLKEKGIIGLDAAFTGIAAHSSEPWKGRSATDEFVAFAEDLRQYIPIQHHESWATTCNIGPVVSNHPRNQLAPELKASLDIRFVDTEVSEDIINKIKTLASRHSGEVAIIFNEPAISTSLQHPLIQLFKKSAESVLNKAIGTTADHGASDARFFARKDIPVLMFKPPARGMHANDESIAIKDLNLFFDILIDYLDVLSR